MVVRKKKKVKSATMMFFSSLMSILLAVYFFMALFKDMTIVVTDSLSDGVIATIKDTMFTHNNIVMIQVLSADPTRNVRKIVYAYSPDPEIQNLYLGFLSNSITVEIPLFPHDEVNITYIVRLINHEFVCVPFKDTLTYKYFPETAKKSSTVCFVSIPPSYGNFKGFVAVYLKTPPTINQQDEIRSFIRDIANKLHSEMK